MTAVIRLRNFILNRLYSAHFYLVLYNFVARLYGVQEAVSSTLATRTKDGCQGQRERQIRKDLALFCFLRLQSRQRLFQAVGDGALAAYVQMAVDVCGHLDVRVAQPLLHVLQTVALRQQHASAGVA